MRTPGDPRTLRADGDAPITVVTPGVVPYGTAWAWQRDLARRRAAGEIGDVLLLLEHPPVYTMGKRADDANLVFDEAERARRGIDLFRIDRGGDVTYHGPGQLVGYPILQLAGPRVVDYVRALEEVNLQVATSYGIHDATRVDGYTGVWVGGNKLTAIGVRVDAGRVTQHGWATNVTTDLSHFTGIVPCGIAEDDKGLCSLRSLGVSDVSVQGTIERTRESFAEVFGVTLVDADATALGLTPTTSATA